MSAVLVTGLTLKVDEAVLREFFAYSCVAHCCSAKCLRTSSLTHALRTHRREQN